MSMNLPKCFDSRHFCPIRPSLILGSFKGLLPVLACASSNKAALVVDLQGDRNWADVPGGGRRMALPPFHAGQTSKKVFFNHGTSRG